MLLPGQRISRERAEQIARQALGDLSQSFTEKHGVDISTRDSLKPPSGTVYRAFLDAVFRSYRVED